MRGISIVLLALAGPASAQGMGNGPTGMWETRPIVAAPSMTAATPMTSGASGSTYVALSCSADRSLVIDGSGAYKCARDLTEPQTGRQR